MEDKNFKFVIGCLVIFLTVFHPLSLLQLVVLGLIALAAWNHAKFRLILRTFSRDIGVLKILFSIIRENKRLKKNDLTPATMLSDLARKRPDDVCFLYEEHTWTFKQVEELSWKVARVFHNMGLKHGDVVALVSTNRPEYVAIWVGLSRLGVVTALVNNSQRKMTLQHSLNVVNPKAIIASADLCQAVCDVKESIPESCKIFKFCGADQVMDSSGSFDLLNALLAKESGAPIEGIAPPKYDNELIYIYTSGTTGLPKAAIMKTSRYLCVIQAAVFFGKITSKDRTYNPLPLYHSAGGVVGVGPAITIGLSCVIRSKFSASKYWEDCAKYKCTVGQYIGEMCRYLLAAPESEFDKKHQVRVMLGNGLKANIWQKFVDRFGVNNIVEFYGATEGNANIVNSDGTVGAVGFLPHLLPRFLTPVDLVRIDEKTGELVRDRSTNLCIRCQPGEPGMFIGKIKDSDATRQYHGYVDKEASAKKIANNVFKKGDKYFMSGDILVMDELGYLFFKDRTGDTFRWKGENVSTTEVENAISRAVGLRDVCVYGVEIPGTDGRAGMATVVDLDDNLDLHCLAASLSESLPSYAQPIFLRIAKKIDMTTTFKLKKFNLQKEGFNPENVGADILYVKKGRAPLYEKLDSQLYEDIVAGSLKF